MTSAISIGKQDFASLRENHYFYVDKTDFIRQWWESGDDITLITRPRRFGKTLNMSMLNCFFSRQYAEKGTIFEGLSIWKQEKYRRLQGTYPVIFLSFADVKQNNYQDAVQKIKNIIVDAYRQHRYLEQEECFTQNEKQQMLEITEKMSDVTAQDALKNLSSYLNLLYGKKVLIFLDEYDTPMQEAYNKEHGITPTTIKKAVRDLISISKEVAKTEEKMEKDPESMSREELEKLIGQVQKQMKAAAAELNFEMAAELRDKMITLKKSLDDMEE